MRLDGFVPPLVVAVSVAAALLWRRFAVKGGRPAADVALVCGMVLMAAGLEWGMGRPVKYRHGPVRLWSGDIRSDQNSQQVADPYSLTHFTHGAAFYGLTWLAMRPAALSTRLIVAAGIEAAWEAYENTDTVVERYRTETISLGYYGDSLINSAGDIVACIAGFLLAWRLPRAATITWVVLFELALAYSIRDNLTLNILMLVYPIDAVKEWQSGALVVYFSWLLAPGSWLLAPGSWLLAPGSWLLAPGSGLRAPGSGRKAQGERLNRR